MAGALPIFKKINYRRGCFMKNFIAPRSLSLPKGRLITIFLLAAFFALSACDDSSSASSDETGVSSSSVESPDSSVTLSGASAESNGSSNETKDKSSSSENKSSSSAKETKVSSDSKSSSSVKTGGSSSSNKDKSSSSENSSSSEKQSSSSSEKQSSSSSVVPKSSSSVFEVDSARLCTPGYAYCNRALGADSLQAGAYKKFKDTRNGREYYYLTINGKNGDGNAASVTVMAENLNIGKMVQGSDDQTDGQEIEKYCYDNDAANCEEYGGLYQWAEMMGFNDSCNTKSCAHLIQKNHQGICPNGWRLLTYDDFYIVVHADGNVNPLVEGVRDMSFGGHNYSGYGLIGAGYNWSYKFKNLNEGTYWFYPEESVKNADVATYSTNQNKYSSGASRNEVYKTHGFSVRCVKVD